MNTPDPHLQAIADFAVHVTAEVNAGRLTPADGLAVLSADALGLALRPGQDIAVRRELADLACQWASERYVLVNSAALLAADPLPADASGLDDGGIS